MLSNEKLIEVLLHQRENGINDSVYKMIQCDFAYNSNHMEGSRLTPEQTRMVFGRKTISGDNIAFDDIWEARNHFEAFDEILELSDEPIDADMLFSLHRVLKSGTSQASNPMYSIGEYKKYENVIGHLDLPTTPPELVADEIDNLLFNYEARSPHTLDDILEFHVAFEKIHPFSDGNGRIGRLLMFKECLRNDITPFIITDDLRDYYIRGLSMFKTERGWLRDTCLTAEDRFIAKYLPIAQSYAKALEEVHVEQQVSLKREYEACTEASHDSDINQVPHTGKDEQMR